VRRAVRTADALYAANSTIARDLASLRSSAPPVLLETGVTAVGGNGARTRPHDPFRIFWCGELRAHKALPLLIRALAILPRAWQFELRIAGSGPERRRWQRLARRFGVAAHICWLGQLTHADVLQQYRWSDVFVFTSLRDTSGNVVLEALAAGVPVICLDHQGARDIVTDRCGIKIAVTTPDEAVEGIRDALVMLAADAGRWRSLGRGAVERAREYQWSVQDEKMRCAYRRVLAESAALAPVPPSSRRAGALDAPAFRSATKQAGGLIAACLNRSLGGRAGGRAGILLFHRIAPHVDGVPPPTDNVTPEKFREQITGLLDRGFRVAALEDLIAVWCHRRPLAPKTVAITFDDAYESVYRNAWPVLRELGLPATIFISTALVNRPEPFPFDTWARRYRDVVPAETYRPIAEQQCREMAGSGLVALGAHGHTHRDLRGCASEFRTDLSESLAQLDARFGRRPWPLAFPFGRADAALVDAARAAGVSCALTTHAALIEPDADPFTWGRFNVYQSDTGETLAAKLHGWYSWLPNLEARIRIRPADQRSTSFADPPRGSLRRS
jgi:peptidoglycan/xylan/chitin deacetylase (PgdA/CDA1 family)